MAWAIVPDLFIGWKLLLVLIGFCFGILITRKRHLSLPYVIVGLIFAFASICILHFKSFFFIEPRNWEQSQRIGELQLFIGFAVGFITRFIGPQKRRGKGIGEEIKRVGPL